MSLSNLAISGDSFSSIGAIGNADGCTEWVLDEIAEAEAFDLFCSALGWVFGSSSPRTGADCQEPELTWNSNCNNQIIFNFVLNLKKIKLYKFFVAFKVLLTYFVEHWDMPTF